ncbi:MAG: MarR family winged helix-turn-helix transcriptional regulator [Acidimicrobiales bacterium]
MALLNDDPRWDTFGLLLEAYRAVDAAIECDTYDTAAYDRQVVDLLIRLARTPGGELRPAAIATALATTRPHTSTLLDRAEEAGLIQRRPDPTDGRATAISLTAKGQRQATKMAGGLLGSVQAHIHDHLSPHDVGQLENMLRTLRDASQEYLRS